MADSVDIARLLRWATSQLEAVSLSPRIDAEILLATVLDTGRSHLRAWPEKIPDALEQREFEILVQRRASGTPVAYLTGEKEFWSLSLQVTPATLVPRPETEKLVETALALLTAEAPLRLADLGTGCGAIALALASERPHWQIIATDQDTAALRVARNNAARLSLTHIDFRQGHWLEPLAGVEELDAIVSNPPYVTEDDPHLPALAGEPRQALVAGEDGLDDIRRIISQGYGHLRPQGWLLLEHGADQGAAVRALMESCDYRDVHTVRDDAGLDRLSAGRKSATQV